MILIDEIIKSIKSKRIRISDHAYEEARNDGLSINKIHQAVVDGEIIEQYSDDRPYPSCLVYGRNEKDEPVHSVWAYNKSTEAAVLVTVYRPDPVKWIDWKKRR